MGDDKITGKLPSQLIDENSFYTLGGASAAVLLVCWAINYVAADVSWLNYKTYRLLGLMFSEAFAIIIMLQGKNRKMIKWMFAFLNGLLIFVNASGLNVMTSSYIFNPVDSTSNKISYFHIQQFRSDPYQQAGVFPFSGMVNWWPDEKLISQNALLSEEKRKLNLENLQLKSMLPGFSNDNISGYTTPHDSMRQLKAQIADKQKQIEEFTESIRNTGDKLQQQLSECFNEKNGLKDSLNLYKQKFISCRQSSGLLLENYNKLRREQNSYSEQINELKKQLTDCMNEKLAIQTGQNEWNNQIGLLKRQLSVCNNEKGSLQENNGSLNAKINELMQRISEIEGNKFNSEATLVELLFEISAKNSRTLKGRSFEPNELITDGLLKNEDFYKAIDWNSFYKNFNTWYLKMSR